MLPLVGTKCGSPTGIPFAFADPGRTVELLNLYDEQHPNHTLLIAGRSGSGKTMTANVLMSRCLALGRAGVRDRPRRALRDAVAARRRRAADRDRRRGLAVRAEPVGRARAGEGAAGEDRVPDRAASGDDGPPRRPAARDARLRHPRGVRQGGRARRLADRVAAARGAARAGRGRAQGRRARDRRDAAEPRRPAVGVLRRGHLRLPARPPDDRAARQPAGDLRHPHAARRVSCSS